MTFIRTNSLSSSKYLLWLTLIALNLNIYGQNSNKIYLGFGGGVNSSFVQTKQAFQLYENLSEEQQVESYTTWNSLTNIGNQYFFHAEYRMGNLVFTGQPGTTSFRFTKNTQVLSNSGFEEQQNPISLIYFSIPLGVKFVYPGEKYKPYIGGKITYGRALNRGGNNQTLIPSKITAGPQLGYYLDFEKFTIDINLGYNFGLHSITEQSQRYINDGDGIYSQSNIAINDLYFNISFLLPLEKSWRMNSLKCNY